MLIWVLTKQETHIWRKSEVHPDIWRDGHPSNIYNINPLWSHNVAHICNNTSFNVDCCYDILQQLLLICMSTKTSVKFLIIYNPTPLNFPNIFQSLNNKQNIPLMKACQDSWSWTEAYLDDVKISEIRDVFYKIMSSEKDIYNFFLNFHRCLKWHGFAGWRRWPFNFI
jgi:hypothetical protein